MPGQIVAAAIAIALLAGPDVSPEQEAPKVQPANDPATWVTIKDYPAEALAGRQEGTVAFALRTDNAGNVASCTVVRGSGSPALDGKTCALLFTRARFRPALDAGGNAVPGSFSSRIQWVYPADYKPAAPMEPVELRGLMREYGGKSVLWVDEQGMITSCNASVSPYSNVLAPPDLCKLFAAGVRFAPPGVANGKPVKRKVTITLVLDDVNVR